MSIYDAGKDALKLVDAVANRPLFEKIVELQSGAMELAAKNLELSKENRDLREALEMKMKMTFRAPFFFIEGDDVPYCPNCWETKKTAIHLVLEDDDWRARCSSCGGSYRKPGSDAPTPTRLSRGRSPQSREPG